MVDEPVAPRRKHRVENGLVAVTHSDLQYKIPPQKINQIFNLGNAKRKEASGRTKHIIWA